MAKIIADALDIDCKDTGCAVVTGVLGASLASLGVGALSMQRARGSSASGGGGADILVTGVTLVAGSIAIVGACSLVFSACRQVREGLKARGFQNLYATFPSSAPCTGARVRVRRVHVSKAEKVAKGDSSRIEPAASAPPPTRRPPLFPQTHPPLFVATTRHSTPARPQRMDDPEEMTEDDLRDQLQLVAQLKKERAILTSETEELRKSLSEVCHAAIVIQKSFRRFQANQSKWKKNRADADAAKRVAEKEKDGNEEEEEKKEKGPE